MTYRLFNPQIERAANTVAREIFIRKVFGDLRPIEADFDFSEWRTVRRFRATSEKPQLITYAKEVSRAEALCNIGIGVFGHKLELPVSPIGFSNLGEEISWKASEERLTDDWGLLHSVKCFDFPIVLSDAMGNETEAWVGSTEKRKWKRELPKTGVAKTELESSIFMGFIRQISALMPFFEWTNMVDVGAENIVADGNNLLKLVAERKTPYNGLNVYAIDYTDFNTDTLDIDAFANPLINLMDKFPTIEDIYGRTYSETLSTKLNNLVIEVFGPYLDANAVNQTTKQIEKFSESTIRRTLRRIADTLCEHNGGVRNNPEVLDEMRCFAHMLIKRRTLVADHMEKYHATQAGKIPANANPFAVFAQRASQLAA